MYEAMIDAAKREIDRAVEELNRGIDDVSRESSISQAQGR
jgi:hypothetical protein